jgi:hypothetical protein
MRGIRFSVWCDGSTGAFVHLFRRFYFFPALTFAHLARCAAAILLRPAAEMVRFVRIRVDFRLLPFIKTFPKVLRAAVTPFNSFSSRFRSCCSCLTTESMSVFAMKRV